jgi:signal transduction histidine kinase
MNPTPQFSDVSIPLPQNPIMVMLIDDQAMVGEAVRRLLADQQDIDLHFCSDARESIEQATQIKPTVILLDLVMPQIDGLEVMRRFRGNRETAHIPVVVLSTTEEPQIKSQAFAAGADDYLVKLPDKIELIARIRYHSQSYLNLVQRDEAYRALRESQQQLLDRNTELSALNQAFLRAKEEAEKASHHKGEFLSRMSHELRTPLNAVLGFGQLLQMEDLSPRMRESVDQILWAGRHLLDLINEVLDISRIEAGRLSLSIEPVSVATVVRETLDLVRPLAAQREISLVNADNCQWHVTADNQRLRQVLLNLLSNAIKYNRPGGTVRISCEKVSLVLGSEAIVEASPDITLERLRISVQDSGAGIAPSAMSKLFTPFERLGADQTEVEGSGIGLALSKRLIEVMGGTLRAESIQDLGSTFFVELPIAASPETIAESLSERQESKPAHGLPTIQAGRSILYIEDNLSNIKLMERLLEHERGVKLYVAMQGSMGLDLARQHVPDLIVLDSHLPDVAGIEVLRELKQNSLTQKIPVVVASADASPRKAEQFLSAGAVEYLSKPLDVRQFLTLLSNTLSSTEPADS